MAERTGIYCIVGAVSIVLVIVISIIIASFADVEYDQVKQQISPTSPVAS